MSRRAYLDAGIGEARGVVVLDGRPERLLIVRDDDPPCQRLGARSVARARKIDRALGLAFLQLPEGPDAVLELRRESGRLVEGQALLVEIRSEGRGDKGPSVRLAGEAEGPPKLAAPAPALEETLAALAPDAAIETGPDARAFADAAEAEALESVFPIPGGGSLAVERTRALIAVDVDVGARPGAEAKRNVRAANLAALAAAARILRLKGEGGLVVIDLAGRGHDGPALIAAARSAFAPDNPGVALGPISRFGTLELTVPRRRRPALERLLDADGQLSLETLALRLTRALERQATTDPGARIRARAAPALAERATPYIRRLAERFGARFEVVADPDRPRDRFEVEAP